MNSSVRAAAAAFSSTSCLDRFLRPAIVKCCSRFGCSASPARPTPPAAWRFRMLEHVERASSTYSTRRSHRRRKKVEGGPHRGHAGLERGETTRRNVASQVRVSSIRLPDLFPLRGRGPGVAHPAPCPLAFFSRRRRRSAQPCAASHASQRAVRAAKRSAIAVSRARTRAGKKRRLGKTACTPI